MNHLAKLPDGELQIMQALWKCSIPAVSYTHLTLPTIVPV